MNRAPLQSASIPGQDIWKRFPLRSLASCVSVVLYVLLLWGVDRWALGVAADAYRALDTVALNALVGLPFLLVLFGLTRRFAFSLLLVFLLQVLLYVVSGMKLQVLGVPLALQDFYFLTNLNRSSLELFGSYLGNSAPFWGAGLVALAVLGVTFWSERPVGRLVGPASGLLLGTGVVLGLLLCQAGWPWSALYTRDQIRPSALGPGPGVLRSGLMSSLLYKHLERTNAKHELDEDALRAVLEATSDERGAVKAVCEDGGAQPDIVMILSESFMDPRVLAGMDEVQEVIPTARALLQRGSGGAMHAPAYGGGTVRTEFEALTGMPIGAFPLAPIPYVDITTRTMPGLPRVLRDRGYTTVALHGNSGAFWNRTDTYRAMGFDRFLTGHQFREAGGIRDGVWYSDASMTDLILRELEQAEQPVFIMAVSIENHGPYTTEKPIRDEAARQALKLPEALRGDARTSLRNYLYHLGNADRQLSRLLDEMERRGRPFVVVFFGDHLPALPEAYSALTFVDGGQPEEQTVPWLIVRDQGRGAPGRRLHSWELAAEALDLAGLAGDPYFDLVRIAGRRLSSLPPDSAEADALRRGVEAAAVARLTGRFEEFLP